MKPLFEFAAGTGCVPLLLRRGTARTRCSGCGRAGEEGGQRSIGRRCFCGGASDADGDAGPGGHAARRVPARVLADAAAVLEQAGAAGARLASARAHDRRHHPRPPARHRRRRSRRALRLGAGESLERAASGALLRAARHRQPLDTADRQALRRDRSAFSPVRCVIALSICICYTLMLDTAL